MRRTVPLVTIDPAMEPTLETGDYLFINTTVSPVHGDIVVIEANEQDNVHDTTKHKWIIKRVIGLPGDTIYAEDGVLWRKNAGSDTFEEVEEAYLGEVWDEYISEETIGEGCVYVMGDHRSVSHDIRAIRQLPLENVMGVVTDWSLAAKEFLTGLFGLFSGNKN